MTSILKPILFIFLVTFSIVSCNNEELFVEPTVETTTPTDSTSTNATTPPEDTTNATNASTPCDFDLSTASSGDTIIIDCIMDLNGQTVNLPSNVTIVYEGGDIINGILNFSDNSVISGELLNSSITLIGSTPQLKDATFQFAPERWGIVEGVVSDEVAANNKNILQDLINKTKLMGADTFKIVHMNAYFKIDSSMHTEDYNAIRIPSDFNFIMTDITYLRVQPHSHYRSALLTIFESSNVNIIGGHLYGDRDMHDYSAGGTQEFGYVILLRSASNIIIKDVKMYDAGGDGLHIDSMHFAYEATYNPSNNILVTNCTIDKSRRNNVSIVDGHDITIENCSLLNAGVNTSLSSGTAPQFAIDIEPVIGANEDKPQQRVERVIIRNNIETGSVKGALVAFEGDDIIITENSFENRVGYNYASNVKIINNTSLGEINAGSKDDWGRYRNKGSIISGNNISNVSVGISATNQDIQIFDNIITNCATGIQLDGLKNSTIHDNSIENTISQSDGINALDYVDGVLIENNRINVTRHSLLIDTVNHSNGEENFSFTFKNNTMESGQDGLISYSYGLNFISNNLNSPLRLDNSQNILFDSNTIKTKGFYAIKFRYDETNNISFINNSIENEQGNGIEGESTSSMDKNFEIKNNTFKIYGPKSGIYISSINGIYVADNNGYMVNGPLIRYHGNNSTFKNNIVLSGTNVTNDIVGTGNIIN